MADDTGTSSPPPSSPAGTARGFMQQVEQALTRLATLKIVTVVGDVDVTGSELDATVGTRSNAPVEAAGTEIDLLNGRIANTFSPGFSTLGGGAMQAFHQAQVEKSSAIVAANLAELQRLAGALLAGRR